MGLYARKPGLTHLGKSTRGPISVIQNPVGEDILPHIKGGGTGELLNADRLNHCTHTSHTARTRPLEDGRTFRLSTPIALDRGDAVA